jgi:hypothetical protein
MWPYALVGLIVIASSCVIGGFMVWCAKWVFFDEIEKQRKEQINSKRTPDSERLFFTDPY